MWKAFGRLTGGQRGRRRFRLCLRQFRARPYRQTRAITGKDASIATLEELDGIGSELGGFLPGANAIDKMATTGLGENIECAIADTGTDNQAACIGRQKRGRNWRLHPRHYL